MIVEPIRLIDVADSYDVLRRIDARPQEKHIILDLSSSTALNMILTQVGRFSYLISSTHSFIHSFIALWPAVLVLVFL